MKGRSLVALAALAVIAALASMWLDRTPGPGPDEETGALLYPDLADSINDIRQVVVEFGAPTERVTLVRADGGWRVAEKDQYAADAGKVRRLLLQLSEARILELKTSNPEFYQRLGVEPIEADAEGSGARLSLEGQETPVALIIGRLETRAGQGTYVRRDAEARSYLVDAELDAGADASDWLDTDIIDVDAASVREVLIRHQDGEELRLLGIEGRLAVTDLPDGRELSSPSVADPIGRGLASLRFEDVVAETRFSDGQEPDAVATFVLVDGRRITLSAWRRDADRYVALEVDLEPETGDSATTTSAVSADAPDAEIAAEPPASPDTDADAAAEVRADAGDVARQQARLDGWVYKISTSRYNQIVRRTEDLLKPAAEEEDG